MAAQKPPRSSRRRREGVTINDVAERAGVSPMTVSRVMNGTANVREETRAAVNAAIEALNYAPNVAARMLASASDVRLGLLHANPSAAYLSEFLVGGLDQSGRSNAHLVLEQCEAPLDEAGAVDRLIRSGIDGVILPPPLCDNPAVIEALVAAKIPAVTVASGVPSAALMAVSIDDFAAASAMTAHLIALGHRRIGFIIGNPNQTASLERLSGYRAALEANGLAVDAALIEQGLFTYRSGLDAAEQLFDREAPPTAIFASNDDMAAAVVAVAHRRRLDVPGDVTVVGFDDTAMAITIWPELTTIHQPIADMSRCAVELLVGEIRNRRGGDGRSPVHRELPFTLIRRQSDAPPRFRPPPP